MQSPKNKKGKHTQTHQKSKLKALRGSGDTRVSHPCCLAIKKYIKKGHQKALDQDTNCNCFFLNKNDSFFLMARADGNNCWAFKGRPSLSRSSWTHSTLWRTGVMELPPGGFMCLGSGGFEKKPSGNMKASNSIFFPAADRSLWMVHDS